MMLCSGLLFAALAQADVSFAESIVRAPKSTTFALRDFSGDGRVDLLRIDAQGMAVALMGADGRLAGEWRALAWPEGRLGWDLSDFDGDGVAEISMLVEEQRVRVHRVDAEGRIDAEGEDLLAVAGSLPVGVHRLHFARDIDGDGRMDVVVPGAGVHRIHLATEDGWADPIQVAYDVRLDVDVGDPEALSSSFGQRVRIPWFQLRDIDGDGRSDLVSRTRDRIAFHLASPELSSEPSWILDLKALREELPEQDGFDFDDLLSNIEGQVSWRIADLDGEGAHDLLVVLGSKFRIYLGGARTGPVGTPDQLLKSSGNVLWSLVRDVEGDALPELQILRGERISIGRVLRNLVLPGALRFDLFTYGNAEGVFSRKPTRRNRVTIEIPRLLTLVDEAEGLGKAFEEQFEIPARRLPRDPGVFVEGDDVVDVVDGELRVFAGCAPAPLVAEEIEREGVDADQLERALVGFFLEDLDDRGDGAERTLDIEELGESELAAGAVLRAACRGVAPLGTHRLAVEAEDVSELMTSDLDGDGRSDVIVVGEGDQGWVLQFLVRRSGG